MKKTIFTWMAMLLLSLNLSAQENGSTFYLPIPDSTILDTVIDNHPYFTNTEVNGLLENYSITRFERAFPTSRYYDTRQIWLVTANSLELAAALTGSFPQYFSHYEEAPKAEPLGYTPNDYATDWSTRRYAEYLEYIKAPDAWSITTGDPNVIIGITDTYLDITHPDLVSPGNWNKLAQVGYNVNSGENHGTFVTGLAVAATDNNTGYPAIGFNCRAHFIGGVDQVSVAVLHNNMLTLSQSNRRVLNGSWRDGAAPSTQINFGNTAQDIYQEIYENGTLSCFAAGNGHGAPWGYVHPAAYDYVFSTSGVGWEGTYGSSTFNVKGVHERTIGDSSVTHQHNPRVDISAPSIRIGGLNYDPNNTNTNDPEKYYHWDGGWGTSMASPMTAGTVGLMLSENSCLSPYQLEYILKESANNQILGLSENLKFTGRLGAGALDAGAALQNTHDGKINSSSPFSCNYAATQTMFIEGIEINTICAPGFSSNSVNPTFTPIIKNGTAPFTYRWEAISGNTTTLNAYNIASPEVVSSTTNGSGQRIAWYKVTVYDASTVQKVASKKIRVVLSTANTWDLTLRDSYMDMLDEPNSQMNLDPRENNLMKSPDLWNRQAQDGVTSHENPEYFTSNPNYVYLKVRNMGCAAYTSNSNHKIRLYWTKASTGENWDADWTVTQVAGSNNNLIPGGLEITANNGNTPLSIPNLQPGASTILNSRWYPPKPEDFEYSPDKVCVCLLARVETNTFYPFGMTFNEVFQQNVITNVTNNNNIVTRNLWVTNLNPGNKRSGRIGFDIANASDAEQAFNIEFISDRTIHRQLAGDFSSEGYIVLYLGDLFERWQQNGGEGSYASIDEDERSVTFNGSDPLVLNNIQLQGNERFSVAAEFVMHDDYEPDELHNFSFHLRQYKSDDERRSLYGNISFEVNTAPSDEGLFKKAQSQKSSTLLQSEQYLLYPNPATDKIAIVFSSNEGKEAKVTIYDVTGRKVLDMEATYFSKVPVEINTSKLSPGMYFINVVDAWGKENKLRFMKK